MDDLIKSFKAQLYDRVTSPLLSSFLLSWAVWNHRLFAVLLTSDLKIKEKFDYVDNVLYPTMHEVGLRGFIWPLLSSLTLLFLYPIPGRWVYEYVRNEQKRLKEIQQKIDDETPITREEAKELKAAIRKTDSDYQKELDSRDERIKVLSKEADDRASQIADLRRELTEATHKLRGEKQPSSLPVRDDVAVLQDSNDTDDPPEAVMMSLSDEQVQLLQRIAEAQDGIDVHSAERLFSVDPVLGQHNIDELSRFNLITRIRAGMNKPGRYKATAAGRAHLVKQRLKLP